MTSMSTSLRSALISAQRRQVRLFTTIGIYEGLLDVETDAEYQHLVSVELHDYTMPGEPALSGAGVVFDSGAIKGLHVLTAAEISARAAESTRGWIGPGPLNL